MSLVARTAVVTGATRGIGAGVARELARQGVQVFITGRTAADRQRIDPGIQAIRCDHRYDTEVDAAFAWVIREAGAIDILVNNVWGGYGTQ